MGELAREIVASIVKSVPDYLGKAVVGFVRWYFRLGIFAMILVACLIGVALIVAASALGLHSALRGRIDQSVAPVLILLLLSAIFIGIIRGR